MHLSYRTIMLSLCISVIITACTKNVVEPEPEPVIPEEPEPEAEPEEPDSVHYVFDAKKSIAKLKIEKGVAAPTLSDAEVARYFGMRIELFTPQTILITKDSTIITNPESEERYSSLWKNNGEELYILTVADNREMLFGKMAQDSILQVNISYSRQTRIVANRSLMVMDQHYGDTPFDVARHTNNSSSHAYGLAEEVSFRKQVLAKK